ncbi:MAG: aspartate--tRNA ligase [Chloroflexi bacterium]|nr:aspartate--tRNA ligase [Chloroflexota bacterium]MDK1044929.1 aspartate--tRNA ligase [Anaerolineales bacterium]MCH8877366.1 aspartate--tRNA ligase [Chloroflexota bacterium]MCI0773779.1 aspartate--tRNA ligase [Chloroflexota bacterium]MCI0807388.1 aspartate--tRNA ligase [Chloroflexota bacterium]
MYKTHGCGDLRAEHVGQRVELAGWVNRRRDHGGLTFVDLRDRSGVVQTVSNPELSQEAHAIAEQVRSEWVLHIVGEVRVRPEGMANPNLPTGEVEVEIQELEVLNQAKTPPFKINEESEVDEMVRLKYRYLDLRRERMQRNLELRYNVIKFIRDELGQRGFWEIETPILFKATPEGARDYLVPSRLYPGEAYALPQSPQQLKQLLMVAGVERYFQIARCFRDEDQRGDRQPEFTQLDIEMSFVEREDVMELLEGVYSSLIEKLFPGRPVSVVPWPRLTYQESMDRFGSDRPDLRFGMELVNITDLAEGSGFKIFEGAVEAGGEVRGINCVGCGHFSRREIDELTEMIKPFGAKGLAYLALQESGEPRSSFAKFLPSDRLDAVIKRLDANPGDLLLFVAGERDIVLESLSRLRAHLGERLELYDPDALSFCWVIDFPLVQWDAEGQRWDPSHHLFTAPMPEDLSLLDSDPGKARGLQYDLVLNGEETAGGSIRIHDRGLQEKIFELIGLDLDTARERFGHMLTAFEYGTPPHGGVASGLDRLCMILAKEPNIREVIAFPKNQAARDVMAGAPSEIEPKQLEELHLRIVE